MKRLHGKDESSLRADIETSAIRQGLSLEGFFQKAATNAQLKPKDVKRKLERFQQGGAAPVFVKKHLLVVTQSQQQ